MADKEISGLVRRLSARSAKSQVMRAKSVAPDRPEPAPKHEMSRAEFKEYASHCDSQHPWNDRIRDVVVYQQCGITGAACRDIICPRLRGRFEVTSTLINK